MKWPTGLALSKNEQFMFVSDGPDHTIRRIHIQSKQLVHFAGVPGRGGHKDGFARDALFSRPAGLVCDNQDNLYICDSDSLLVRKINILSGVVTTICGSVCVKGHVDGAAFQAMFWKPKHILHDSARHRLLITDRECIRSYDFSTGQVGTVLGPKAESNPNTNASASSTTTTATTPSTPTGTTVSEEEEIRLKGIAVDARGTIVVADNDNGCVRFIRPGSSTVEILVGNTAERTRFQDGSRKNALFNQPYGVAIHPYTGDLFVTDSANCVIRRITGTGLIGRLNGQVKTFKRMIRLSRLLSVPLKSDKRALQVHKCLLQTLLGNFFDRSGFEHIVAWGSDRRTLVRGVADYQQQQQHQPYLSSPPNNSNNSFSISNPYNLVKLPLLTPHQLALQQVFDWIRSTSASPQSAAGVIPTQQQLQQLQQLQSIVSNNQQQQTPKRKRED